MSIEVLATVILQHGFRSRINGGVLYGEKVYSDESGFRAVWEPIRANIKAVKRWLGY
jgi:hypothetical protein